MKFKIFVVETFLGLGLGLGYLTSLRFFGSIGISEILIAISLILMIKKNPNDLLKYQYKSEKFLRIYLYYSTIIILPLITLITYILNPNIQISDPKYVASFIMGILLLLLVFEGIRSNKIDPKKLIFWFSLAFLSTNFISIFILNLDNSSAGERYTGGANNPNQITFYAATLSLLLVTYNKKLSLLFIPLIIFILEKSKSDAYFLALVMIAASYIYFKLIFENNLSVQLKIIFSLLLAAIMLMIANAYYSELIHALWLSADEGDSRLGLMYYGLIATLHSPLFGFGAGSFSGMTGAFQGSEAHNTFLDFSMQFGLIFPIILYTIIARTLIISLKKKNFVMASFVVGFIESGLFHFSGRHFSFWIELAVFLAYIYPARELVTSTQYSN